MTMMKLNPNVMALKESATLRNNQQVLADRREGKGKPIIHFGFGQSPFPVPPLMVEELARQAAQKDYLPTRGLVPLREQIAHYYRQQWGYEFHANEVVIAPGSKELLFQTLFILAGPVLIPAPSWVSYGPQAELCNRPLHPIFCTQDNHYKLRGQDLFDYCQHHFGAEDKQQKILIINSPNNPTGAVYENEEIAEIVAVCKRLNIIVISDEIYGEIDFSQEWQAGQRKGFFSLYPEGTIVTGGLSKAHSAGGWRLGFLATSPHFKDFLNALSAMISETYSAVSAPIQHSAIIAYSQHSEIQRQIATCRRIHQAVGSYMAERFQQMGVSVSAPQGAFYLLPDFSSFGPHLKNRFGITTSDDLIQLIYHEIQLAMLPASDFYMPKEFLAARVATVDYNGPTVLQAADDNGDQAIGKQFIAQHCPRIVAGMDRLQAFFAGL